MPCKTKLIPLADRGPLRVMFIITSMPVGGAEVLLVNLIRKMNRERILPELCCLKSLGPLGEELAREIPVFSNLLTSKYDLRVFPRLCRLLRSRRIDAVVTVGAGDKMFWGRLAAWWCQAPVVLSALHSTGWPDVIGRLNRMLTPLTDRFIAVAQPHGRYLAEVERFPEEKICVIPNGVDTDRFTPGQGVQIRRELGLAGDVPIAGIVAALRPEKDHELFLKAAALVRRTLPTAHFLVVGDGPLRQKLESTAAELGVSDAVHFLGTRQDIPETLRAMDVFVLSSKMEANPVSILEAMSTATPVVASAVGSIGESVQDGVTGFLLPPGSVEQFADRIGQLLRNRGLAVEMGSAGRDFVVKHCSLDGMVRGYEQLLEEVYSQKCTRQRTANRSLEQPSFEPQAVSPR